jgi:hypothetical protein
MRLCPTCSRPRAEGRKTCDGCGRPFPSGLANLPDIVAFGSGPASAKARSAVTKRPAAYVAIAIVLVAGGTGALLLFGRHGPAPPVPPPTTSTPAATSPASVSPSASPTGSPSPAPSSLTTVKVTAAAAQEPAASSVAAFVGRYFTAINLHHYHAYLMLLSVPMQQGMTRASFNSGYRGTVDSVIRLVSISAASDGDTQAALTFTSHQTPDLADHEESCTDWNISLFLVQGSGGYFIAQPPPGYQATSAPCS